MTKHRFAWGLGLLAAAVVLLVLALTFEHTPVFKTLLGGVTYLVLFSALTLAGCGLLWSDVGRRPLRWVVAVGVTLVVLAYHAMLAHGPG